MKSKTGEYEKRERTVPIRVHPIFRNTLKAEAALSGMSICQYTKKLGGSPSLKTEFDKKLEEKKKNGGGFNFNPF